MSEYDEKLCKERCKTVDKTLNDHENRLNGHSARLDKLEQNDRENRNEIKHLCEQIKSLVNTLKWGFGILVTIALFVLGYLIKIR